MRIKLLLLLFELSLAFMPLTTIAQTTTVSFGYDPNGNRTTRQLIFEELLTMRPHVSEESSAHLDNNMLDALDIKLFPNPTYGKFYLDISGDLGDVLIKAVLLTSSGNIISNKDVGGGHLEYDISNQADGNYLLQLFLKNELRVWKIIKE